MSKQIFHYNSNQTLSAEWLHNYVIFNPQGNVYIFLEKLAADDLDIGWETEIIRKGGDGNIRFTLDNGVYLNCKVNKPQSDGDKSIMFLKKIGDSEFLLHGDIRGY